MNILDQIADTLGLGPNSWDERLRKTIDFVSPEGNQFSAYWRGSPRTTPKKLGIFSFPKVDGNIVQDLGTESAIYDLTFWFEGVNNDLEARAFFAALKERGQWSITHPVHGFIGLQPMTVTQYDEPVENGNITRFESTWIEPIDPETLKTSRELAGIIDSQANQLNLNAVEQFAANVNAATEALKETIAQATQLIENASERTIGPIASIVDSVDSAFLAVQDGIRATLNATVLEVRSLAGQIQQLIQLPLLAVNDIRARLTSYSGLTDEFFDTLPGGPNSIIRPTELNQRAINSIATTEVSLMAVVSSLGQIVTTGVFQPTGQQLPLGTSAQLITTPPIASRIDAVALSQEIVGIFEDMTAQLDAIQESFEAVSVDRQYFSQSSSYSDAALLVNLITQYLLIVAYDLQVEKRFTLDSPRTPIDIVISEYGELGENDRNLDIFIVSNGLKGNDILMLPAGREVLIYA